MEMGDSSIIEIISMKTILGIIITVLILGIWLPVIPFPVKQGWYGVGSEWCGFIYQPSCDRDSVRFMTYSQIKIIIDNHAY